MHILKRTAKALIVISLSVSLLVACSGKEEKVTASKDEKATTTNEQEKITQSQKQDQSEPVEEKVDTLENLPSNHTFLIPIPEGISKKDIPTHLVKDEHGNDIKIKISIQGKTLFVNAPDRGYQEGSYYEFHLPKTVINGKEIKEERFNFTIRKDETPKSVETKSEVHTKKDDENNHQGGTSEGENSSTDARKLIAKFLGMNPPEAINIQHYGKTKDGKEGYTARNNPEFVGHTGGTMLIGWFAIDPKTKEVTEIQPTDMKN